VIRLAKYLKPHLPKIVLAVALLFVQAMADLALPDYMSRIVNNGIQQGGIENAVPIAIRQREMDRLTIFMSDEERTQVLDSYTLVDSSSPDYDTYVKDFPVLASEPVYVLNDTGRAHIEQLNPIMGKSLLVVFGIEQALADPTRAAQMAADSGFDLSRIPPGMDVFALLSSLPAAQLAPLMERVNQRFETMGEKMVIQAAVVAVRAEYEALGLDAERLQLNYIIRTGLQMLGLTLLTGACVVAVGFLAARTAAGLARDLRRGVFVKVEGFSSAELDRFSTASLITRTTNDVTQIQMVTFMMIRMVFFAPIIGVGGVIRALGKAGSMWWIIAVAVVTLIGLVAVVFAIALPKFKSIQTLVDRLNLVMRENLSGMMVVRAFNMQDFELNRFDRANTDLTGTMLFVSRIMAVMMPVMMFLMNSVTVLIIWVGAHQVAQSNIQVGDMMAFLQYALQIVMSFLMLSMMFIILPRASVSADRIAEVLDTELSIRDPEHPKQFKQPFRGVIEFRNVSFRYPGAEEDVLHDISFVARPGEVTAFIGSTGSGKSTIINLIPRFYDVTEGAILIDDIDIREVAQHDLRDKIGYIPQRGMLFSGTIESNLRYADEHASDHTLQEALQIAQAEFVFENPAGMEAEIAQGGANVSGGQKQRLSIARALVKKPSIYIFDDSFSALDFKTDVALRRALRQHVNSSTVLIVTQRVSSIKDADQIIVLEEGRIVGKGTHHELMESCETYREIALSQLNKQEVA
jgi:ATP-binding cassette subfamily B protein